MVLYAHAFEELLLRVTRILYEMKLYTKSIQFVVFGMVYDGLAYECVLITHLAWYSEEHSFFPG